MRGKNPAVFIDRDGTIIREKNYLRRVKDIAILSCAVPALRLLKDAGYRLILVTNQSGVGRGYFTEEKVQQIHRRLAAMLEKKGVRPDAIYFCPHLPDAGCDCRKPNLGMVHRARKKFNLDLARSFSIGDHRGDFLLGQRMGGKGIFVLTGHGAREYAKMNAAPGPAVPDAVARDVLAAARWIVNGSKRVKTNGII